MLLTDLVGSREDFCWKKFPGSSSYLYPDMKHSHPASPTSRQSLVFKQHYTVARQSHSVVFCQVAKHVSSTLAGQQLVSLSLRAETEVVGLDDMPFLENEFLVASKSEILFVGGLFIFYTNESSLLDENMKGQLRGKFRF